MKKRVLPPDIEYADMDRKETRNKVLKLVEFFNKEWDGTLTEQDKMEIRNDPYLNRHFNQQYEKRQTKPELKKYIDELQDRINKKYIQK